MIQATLLTTRPNYDYTTRYISAWAQVVVEEARKKGNVVLDLYGNRARKAEFESIIEKQTPSFIFMCTSEMRTRPAEDKIAALFLNPSSQVALSLLKGHTAQEAHANAKKAFLRTIRKLLNSQTSKEDTTTVRYLLWDMQNLLYQGDAKAAL